MFKEILSNGTTKRSLHRRWGVNLRIYSCGRQTFPVSVCFVLTISRFSNDPLRMTTCQTAFHTVERDQITHIRHLDRILCYKQANNLETFIIIKSLDITFCNIIIVWRTWPYIYFYRSNHKYGQGNKIWILRLQFRQCRRSLNVYILDWLQFRTVFGCRPAHWLNLRKLFSCIHAANFAAQ